MQEKKAVAQIIKKEFNQVAKIERMTTGTCNEVFSVSLPNKQVIVRLNVEPSEMIGSETYIPLLSSKGIPVPKIIDSNYDKKIVPFAYQILSKIDGQDIGKVIAKLSDKQLKNIAKELVKIIKKLSKLSTNGKFGWVGNERGPLYNTWLEILKPTKVIARDKKTGVVGDAYIKQVKNVLKKYKAYFDNVKSTFYYDDMSSKNVIIHKGKFVGLVDLDTMAYGDPLEAVGRIKASWYGTNYGNTYTKAMENGLKLSMSEKEIVTVYAFLNRVHWLSEKGIKFNKNTSKAIDKKGISKDRRAIDGLANELGI